MEVKKDPDHNPKIVLTKDVGIMMKYPSYEKMQMMDGSINSVIEFIDYIYSKDNIYYAKDTPKEELVDFIEHLQKSDFSKIEKFFATIPVVSKTIEEKCSKCGFEHKVVLEGLQSFFD